MSDSLRERLVAKFCLETMTVEFPCMKEAGHDGEHGSTFKMPRMTDNRATHSFAIHLREDKCRCGKPAAHKVEDTSGPQGFHPMTNYLCCEHFTQWVGQCGSDYPWDYDSLEPRANP